MSERATKRIYGSQIRKGDIIVRNGEGMCDLTVVSKSGGKVRVQRESGFMDATHYADNEALTILDCE